MFQAMYVSQAETIPRTSHAPRVWPVPEGTSARVSAWSPGCGILMKELMSSDVSVRVIVLVSGHLISMLTGESVSPNPKWATGSIWQRYPEPPSITRSNERPSRVVILTSAPRAGAPCWVSGMTRSHLLAAPCAGAEDSERFAADSPCDTMSSSFPSLLKSVTAPPI